MGRYKAIIGPCLRARTFSGQRAEAAVLPLPFKEGWAGKRRSTTDNALLLKPRWADTRPSLVLAYGPAASLGSRLKRLSAWPSSIECSTRAAPTLFAVSIFPRKQI